MEINTIWKANDRVLVHVIFWLCIVAFLTTLFEVGGPGFKVAFNTVMMLFPVHVVYFYTLSYVIIPKYLYTRKFLQLTLSFVLLAVGCLLAYRVIEILFADPYFFKEMRKVNPNWQWQKIEGTFLKQLTNMEYMIHGLEQSNSVVWIALVIKFFRMWYERKQVALQAELNFLKSQIHPHFLFNTLNNLYALTLDQSPKSSEVVLGLSDILRYMLYECNADYVSLKRDVAIIQNYLTLEQLRYGDRLDLNFSIKGSITDQRIAPLLMIPLIENAFKHGASEMTEEAWINIDLDVDAYRLKLKVSNSKPGQPIERDAACGNIGLQNLKKRLELMYPETHLFTTYDEQDMYLAILQINFGAVPNLITTAERETSSDSGHAGTMFSKPKTSRSWK
ncbi:sensor histidine kinase [Parapedobacter indicus]|uniref:Histidine kinase n=1 Tax=Parapedobacter indicus TaxID=1477437 RepID=A0A1I3UTF7_9SPHI|nr:histidine kinase [Parapedobacter indicus]PPK99130.1 histidine kinase [Parapedobacter indicus]SFJ85131.1 Histidine kinase [Parapedobacter indicus]